MTKQSASWTESYSMPALPDGEKFARLSGLPERLKRDAWHAITSEHPGLALLLREPQIKAMIDMFDAELFVEASMVPMLPVEQLKGRKRESG